MLTYLLICSWFISGGICGVWLNRDCKMTRVEYIRSICFFCTGGYVVTTIFILVLLGEKYEKSKLHKWLNSEP